MSKVTIEKVGLKFKLLRPYLNERQVRLWVGAEAESVGHGGIKLVSVATGMSANTVRKGKLELLDRSSVPSSPAGMRVRRPGAGRPRLEEQDPDLVPQLLSLVDPTARGAPDSPLRWTCKSTRKLSKELTAAGHPVSPRKVASLLIAEDFSLQSPRKTKEGTSHPDRDAQFRYINAAVVDHHKRGQPTISVDSKKKELVGDFHNGGAEWHPSGHPPRVNTHDFPSMAKGKAVPHGIYDIFTNKGWVSVGISCDTAEFAVGSIRRWWNAMGSLQYPDAEELLITADCGGSNGYRSRLWKYELQQFADEMGISVAVVHFPPGTSKWNKIEHRMFSHITMNWRGRPLTSYEVVVNCIAATKTSTGFSITAQLDRNQYQKGIKVTDQAMSELNIVRAEFHGEWNYVIRPRG